MPQIAQQDYLEYEVNFGINAGEDLPDSFKRAMFRHLRQGTLLDVVLHHVDPNVPNTDSKARILAYWFEDNALTIYFIDTSNDEIKTGWFFTEPEPEPQTEEE